MGFWERPTQEIILWNMCHVLLTTLAGVLLRDSVNEQLAEPYYNAVVNRINN